MTNPAQAATAALSQRHALRLLIALAAIALLISELAYQTGALSGLDNTYTDLWHRLSGVRYQPQHTALVVVDEASLV